MYIHVLETKFTMDLEELCNCWVRLVAIYTRKDVRPMQNLHNQEERLLATHTACTCAYVRVYTMATICNIHVHVYLRCSLIATRLIA